MSLIKSISGIRGTIGGKTGKNLTPIDIVLFTSSFGTLIQKKNDKQKHKIVIGRDARISGKQVNQLVINTLSMLGIDVIDFGLSTTPSIAMAVEHEKADGGIIITASHNPANWNALKFLNQYGEFIDDLFGKKLLALSEKSSFNYISFDKLGSIEIKNDSVDRHIDAILSLDVINLTAIRKANFKVVVDAVNSTGGFSLARLFERIGVKYTLLYGEPTGDFLRNPEPLPEHLTELSKKVVTEKADVGFAVDPDVDRLAIVCENGEMFGEEYTLVACADYVIDKSENKNTVSNLSSTMALRDITLKKNGQYFASAVGEVNVVKLMKKENAEIGGEGNGGIIYSKLHYGRDAILGVVLFLSSLAEKKIKCSELKTIYPEYFMLKSKIELDSKTNIPKMFDNISKKYASQIQNKIDGLKIFFDNGWLHIRSSNTEPIIRIYAESNTRESAEKLVLDLKKVFYFKSL